MSRRRMIYSLLILLIAIPVSGQDTSPMKCVVTIYRLRGERWKLIKALDFLPNLQEEEMTNQKVRLHGTRLNLFASTFPTDESMNSNRGPDSLKLGLAISRKSRANAFDLVNNAVAETTLSELDTIRVEKRTHVNGKPMMTRLECWDSEMGKKKEKERQ